MVNSSSKLKIIDALILFFMILFLLSLANSIFVNQLGYYGALILILTKYFIAKENQFKRTGLEFAFVWFVLAEILSAVFSQNHSLAFTNVLKRTLLIPLVYTTISASVDLKRTKLFFKIYIGASLITLFIYLFFAYRFYIFNLYSIKESGPSLFQYPITASEITSFTVLFFFAFLINEKTNWKLKLFYLFGFGISALALISTYKRTGWIGAAFGIFIILLIKKEWKYIIPLFTVGIILLFTQKNISKVEVFSLAGNHLNREYSITTDGLASAVMVNNDFQYISDYQNGIAVYKDSSFINNIELPSATVSIKKWKDDYYVAQLIDTRFVLLKKSGTNFKIADEFISTGFTMSYAAANNFLYLLDSDSGITIFKNPENLKDTVKFSGINGFVNVYVDSSRMVLYKQPDVVKVINLQNYLPTNKSFEFKDSSKIDFVYSLHNKIFISDAAGLKLLSTDSSGIHFLDEVKNISKLYRWDFNNGRLFAANTSGNLVEFKYPVADKIEIVSKYNLGFGPSAITYHNQKIFAAYTKTSRLLSIFDPYNPSNAVRLALWRAGISIWLDHPVFGVGDIDLRVIYSKYKRYYDKEIQGHLHNNFFHILATLGLFGFLAVVYLMFKILIIDLKIYKETKGIPFVSSYALGVIGAYCAFIVSGLTEFNFGDHEIITLVWFTLGLNIAFFYLSRPQEKLK